MKILTVCLGNICRSPLAQGVLEDLVAKQGLDWIVDSAGTSDWHNGESPDRRSIDVARRNGINISNQHSRPVVPLDFEYYDIILAMDKNNMRDLLIMSGKHHADKIKLLLEYLDDSPLKEVPDPYYSGGFDYVFELVRDACSAFIQKEQHIQLK
jgi:protein-tyrosine phosphatase